jgi:3-mercaptopyruvate sulfurtransferase SseA
LSQEATENRLRELKIGIETPVMCYDSSNGKFAARVACLLSSVGVKNVMILDGEY